MSTRPSWMNGSRLAETVSTHSILSSGMPSSAGDHLGDLHVEADGLAVGAQQAEQRLIELGADGDRAGLGQAAIVVPASNVGLGTRLRVTGVIFRTTGR